VGGRIAKQRYRFQRQFGSMEARQFQGVIGCESLYAMFDPET
jgi:hypothetical protein